MTKELFWDCLEELDLPYKYKDVGSFEDFARLYPVTFGHMQYFFGTPFSSLPIHLDSIKHDIGTLDCLKQSIVRYRLKVGK